MGRTVHHVKEDVTETVIRIKSNVEGVENWFQTEGIVHAEQVSIGEEGQLRACYTISGGSFRCTEDLILGTKGRFTVKGCSVDCIHTKRMNLQRGAQLEFRLASLGVTSVEVTEILEVEVDSNCHVTVDGTDYVGFDGYFPLIQANLSTSQFDIDRLEVTFIGFKGREPALVQDGTGLWLRLLAPPALSERLCSLVPDSTVTSDYADSNFSTSRAFEPSGSAWSLSLNEGHVMDTRLSQTSAADTYSWDMRVGRGGFVYSLRTPLLGETVPPSWRHAGDTSPWNDEVWQGVAVDNSQNDVSAGSPYFLHQSGVYLKDPALKKPFYSPQVASSLNAAERTFTTVNWTPQAHINIYVDGNAANNRRSYLLMYTRYKDLDQGVIEVTLGYYNYGPDTLDFLNMPWGGVRRSSMEYAFLSEPNGMSWSGPITESFANSLTARYNETGGWVGYSAAPDGSSPVLGLVYGSDHNKPLPNQKRPFSTFRCGYAGGRPQDDETKWRNYFVTATIRWYTLAQGEGVWSRHYFALGSNLKDLSDRIAARDLVDAQLQEFDYTESSTPIVGYRFTAGGDNLHIEEDETSPDLLLYAHPVRDSLPVFEVIEKPNSRYLTWNPYSNGIIKPYDGSLGSLRLLGFALRTRDINKDGLCFSYTPLADLLSDASVRYIADGEELSTRTTRN